MLLSKNKYHFKLSLALSAPTAVLLNEEANWTGYSGRKGYYPVRNMIISVTRIMKC